MVFKKSSVYFISVLVLWAIVFLYLFFKVMQPPGNDNIGMIAHTVQSRLFLTKHLLGEGSSMKKPLVILFSYERSGSTLLGELFNQNPQVFYFYEPLRDQYRELSYPRPVNNTKHDQFVSSVMKNVLTCNFSALSPAIMTDHVLLYKSISLTPYRKCLQRHKLFHKCIHVAEKLCENKTFRVLKTVRSTMESIEALLRAGEAPLAELKVIHLTRDPRGQFTSLITSAGMKRRDAKEHCKKICDRTTKDVLIRKKLQKAFPGKILGLHYEDMAQEPVITANQIYQFIHGQNAPQKVPTWLNRNTRSTRDNLREEEFETERRDSVATAFAWKKALSGTVIRDIDRVCAQYYKVSGLYNKYEQ